MSDKKIIRVMMDVETLGIKRGSVVTEAALLAMDEDWREVGSELRYLDVSDSLVKGMQVEESTWKWREDQGCVETPGGGDKLRDYCAGLTRIVASLRERGKLEFWSWGSFDQDLLEGVYDVVGKSYPWQYHEWRDARTVCKVAGVMREGEVTHEALDDCWQQMYAIERAFKVLGLNFQKEGVA